MSYQHVITELINSRYRQENEVLQDIQADLELDLRATQRARNHAQEHLEASERTRQDLSEALQNMTMYANLQESRVWAFVEGIENYFHLTYQAERSLLLEQLTLSFRRHGVDFHDLIEDPEATESEEERLDHEVIIEQ